MNVKKHKTKIPKLLDQHWLVIRYNTYSYELTKAKVNVLLEYLESTKILGSRK